VGLAPRRYIDIFKWATRKEENGNKINWDQNNANPRLEEEPSAISKKEDNAATVFIRKNWRKGFRDLKKET